MVRLFSVLVLFVVFSCGVDSTEIGSNFFTGNAIDISYVDTATVSLSTIKFDSLIASNTTRLLAGTYKDKRLGTVMAVPFIEFSTTSTTSASLENKLVAFERIAITLKPDGYSWSDTLQPLTLSVHRLSSKIETDASAYYNTSTFKYQDTPIGTLTFKPKPHRDDSVEINLPDAFGQELLKKIMDDDDAMSEYEDFIRYFRGIALVPDTTVSASILGFSMQPEVRIYYKDKNKIPVTTQYISFPVTSGKVFSHIKSDLSRTTLSSLIHSEQRIKAIDSNDEAYMQAGVGLGLRVDIPYLKSFSQLRNYYVSKAILDLYPVRKSYNTKFPLPDQLTVYKVDGDNTQYGMYQVTAPLYEDTDLQRDTRYQFDITDFVKDQMALESVNENALVFLATDSEHGYASDEVFRYTTDRLYMANPGGESKTRLRIYFTTLNY